MRLPFHTWRSFGRLSLITAAVLAAIYTRRVDAANLADLAKKVPLITLPAIDSKIVSKAAARVSLAPIQKWQPPIDSYGPPHDVDEARQSVIEQGGELSVSDPLRIVVRFSPSSSLASDVRTWETRTLNDESTPQTILDSFPAALSDCHLNPTQAAQLARSMVYFSTLLDDQIETPDEACIAATCAVIVAAGHEDQGIIARDPGKSRSLRALNSIYWIWQTNNYATVEECYKLIAGRASNSRERRRAMYLRAEAVAKQHDYDRAISTLNEVISVNNALRDVAPSDVAEFEWAAGLYLFASYRTKDAIPHFESACQYDGGTYTNKAYQYLAQSYAEIGDTPRAKKAFNEWVRRAMPTASQVSALDAVISGKVPEQ